MIEINKKSIGNKLDLQNYPVATRKVKMNSNLTDVC